jgi:hypothetical protein
MQWPASTVVSPRTLASRTNPSQAFLSQAFPRMLTSGSQGPPQTKCLGGVCRCEPPEYQLPVAGYRRNPQLSALLIPELGGRR